VATAVGPYHSFLFFKIQHKLNNMSHIKHLKKDPILKPIIEKQNTITLTEQKPIFLHLCYAIMGQQLSTAVADIIRVRFHELFKKKIPTPQDILAVPFMELKKIGLSTSKTNYMLNVCDFFIENKTTDAKLHKMEDEELIEFLTSIKGVGKWTVEMVMMFAMGRENVFPSNDLGIQQQMKKLYKIRKTDKKEIMLAMETVAEQWAPYRTYACMYLWNDK